MSNEPGGRSRRDRTGSAAVWQGNGHRAAAYIRELIFDGELGPGARVPQGDIARELGMSRIPVREALVALEKEGRVTIELNRGAFVVPMTEDSVVNAMEFVDVIFDFLVPRAAERATPELIADLRSAQNNIDGADDPYALRELVREWRDLVTEAGTTRRVARAVSALWDLAAENNYAVVPGAAAGAREGTRTVTDAISNHDAIGAERAYTAFSRSSHAGLLEYFRNNGTFVSPDDTGAAL